MKLTKNQLNKIIKEELESLIQGIDHNDVTLGGKFSEPSQLFGVWVEEGGDYGPTHIVGVFSSEQTAHEYAAIRNRIEDEDVPGQNIGNHYVNPIAFWN